MKAGGSVSYTCVLYVCLIRALYVPYMCLICVPYMCALYVCLICDDAAVFRRTLIIQTNLISINAEKDQKDVAALTSLLTNHFSHQTPPTLQHAGSATATSYSSLRSGDDALVLQESALATCPSGIR